VHGLFHKRWLAAHLLVLVAVPIMVRLGVWQLGRLGEKRAYNAAIAAALDRPPLPLLDAVQPSAQRYVWASGTFDSAESIALRGQSLNGIPGLHLLTPLRLHDGRAVLVDRGWIPINQGARAFWQAYAVAHEVRVVGIAYPSQTTLRHPLAASDRPLQAGARLDVWSRVDLARIEQQIGYALLPVYLQQIATRDAAGGRFPQPPSAAPSGEGPHAGYAAQWFTFAALTVALYLLGVTRASRGRQPTVAQAHKMGSVPEDSI
jgi:surfeit locus 1 family protein